MLYWITLCSLLLLFYAGLMIFYFIGWKRTKAFPVLTFSPNCHVSVIIAARNEERNIERCLRSVLSQNYPAHLYEVIVVDDQSEDKTFSLAENISAQNLQVLKLNTENISNRSYKKQAIAQGVAAAAGELIVTTDADCEVPRNWLRTIAGYYEKYQPGMIAGPVAFSNGKTFLEKWQALDMCGMMTITAGAIRNNFPNMCNGANLAYTKKIFNDTDGFSGIDSMPSGDDVMLMLKVSKKFPGSIHFLKSREAVVITQPLRKFSELVQQRLRWISKGTEFPDRRLTGILMVTWLFYLCLTVNFAAGFFIPQLMALAAISIVIKTLVELPLLFSGCSFFGNQHLLWSLLPSQLLHTLYITFIGPAGSMKRFTWKGRHYR